MERYCVNCDAPITACFGFTFARDLAAHQAGERFAREMCGRCVEIMCAPDVLRELGQPVSPELDALASAIRAHYAWPDPLCPSTP